MILWLVVIFLIGVAFVLTKLKVSEDLYTPPLVISFILIFIGLIFTPIFTYNCLKANEEVQRLKEDISILEERFAEQKVFIMASIQKYPLEEDLLKNFNPNILLNLPEIKSDKVIMESMTLVLKIQDDIYQKKMDINKANKKLRIYSHRWFIPTIIKPKINT